ncbi:MAG: hypothetical protein B0D96_10440 [Candidatus Sedimenticola endophacoides]|nr:MAG: hypothetical protein B0D96_10440 [Candidatus Sedimenticola endophacoides]OQX41838.1 MAG: hypothetical protein B0D89_02815 [Candidatus Sedimenticola endophacoides]OQX42676.1 MAG: hypothetical protein B0D88_06225 [Candidatus Sedimenticola endophacoides]OQX49177.1 MAG: hypothetical protein B0D87_01715 [Candidatus Sedimenticola endophacoides]
MLQRVVQRFKRVFRLEDTVIRFGGDEFVVIAEDLSTPADAEKIAGHVLDAFTAPVSLENIDLVVTASIGIALFPLDARDGSELLRHADSAMYLSKAAGRNQYSFYTQDLGSEALEYVELGSLLSRAIANRELALHYQPQFYLQSGELAGVEALVRWPGAGPERRHPGAFIPFAELSGLIEPLGLWVIDEACRQAAEWQREGFSFGRIAVNLSSRQLNNVQLWRQVRDLLDQHGIDGSRLEFEITESMVVQEGGTVHGNIEALASMGISLAIDDFGTGHSSLVNLKRFPLSRLKIDRSFVDGLGSDPNDEAIAGATIALARALGLEVVAEGVESGEQAAFLRQQGCQVVQGFRYARPLDPDELLQHFAAPVWGGNGVRLALDAS